MIQDYWRMDAADLSAVKKKSKIHVSMYCSAKCTPDWYPVPPKLNVNNDIVVVDPSADYPVHSKLFADCDIRHCYRVDGVVRLLSTIYVWEMEFEKKNKIKKVKMDLPTQSSIKMMLYIAQ